jgi:glycerol kinase
MASRADSCVLALDQGTTGSTALAFGPEGEVLGRAYTEITQHYPAPGWVEHDPEEIWRSVQDVARRALEAAGLPDRAVRAIGITNQRETTVLWDRLTGHPLYPAIVWQSRQTAEVCERLRRGGHETLLHERTGLVLDPYFSASKIAWLLERDASLRARADLGDVAFGTIDSWLIHRLTAGEVHATDPTNAARTLLFDIHSRQWSSEILSLFGIPASILPDVKPSCGFFGATAPESGLPAGVPIAGVAGDQQAALFGQGCVEAGMAKNTYGTGAFLVLNTGKHPVISRKGLLTTLCCDARGDVAYALEGAVFVAGAAVQWLRDELGLIGSAAETGPLAATVADTAGVYVVPAFTGLGAPYWDADARGAIVGLTRGAGRAHLVRATLESLAYQSRDVIDAMNEESGVPLRELRVDGGASANDFLMQFQADVLGVPVDRPALVETTAAGAAFLAGLASGFWKDAEALTRTRRRDRLFTPSMTPKTRESLYAGWLRAVARVRSSPAPRG